MHTYMTPPASTKMFLTSSWTRNGPQRIPSAL